MPRQFQRFIAVAIFAAIATGCAKQPPKCSDEATYSLLRQIIMEKLGGNEGASEAEITNNLKFELARASSFDEKVKKYSCEAKLIAGDAYQLPVKYESQLDDKNDHIVYLAGISRADWMMVNQSVREGVRKAHEAKAPVATPAEATPPAPSPQSTVTQPAIEPKAAEASAPAVAPQEAPAAAVAPSFDCAKASSLVETTICTNATLGKLDGALAENYKFMLASDIGDGAINDLKATQRKWMASRNKCTDHKCLEEAYRKRVDDVCEYPVISGVHPACVQSADIK